MSDKDTIYRQAAIDYVDDVPYIKDHPNIALLWKAWVEQLPSAQPEQNCVLTVWGECSYAKTGCSDCEIKARITKALLPSAQPIQTASNYLQSLPTSPLLVGKMPSVQTEIIRCKDCVYWDFSGYCVDFMTQDENGFCSWAKRRTDG